MVRLAVSLFLALCLTPLLVLAQSDTATVSGLITDSKGAVLVGAQVRAVCGRWHSIHRTYQP